MTLATADQAGNPSARIVLLKGADQNGFTFFTNYESQKGRDLAVRPQAALLFHWHELERQVRIQGVLRKSVPLKVMSTFIRARLLRASALRHPSRLHDRMHYKLVGKQWSVNRLAP